MTSIFKNGSVITFCQIINLKLRFNTYLTSPVTPGCSHQYTWHGIWGSHLFMLAGDAALPASLQSTITRLFDLGLHRQGMLCRAPSSDQVAGQQILTTAEVISQNTRTTHQHRHVCWQLWPWPSSLAVVSPLVAWALWIDCYTKSVVQARYHKHTATIMDFTGVDLPIWQLKVIDWIFLKVW